MSDSARLDRAFADHSAGVSVRYPSGWRIDTRNPTAVLDPAFCFDLASPSHAVLVRVVEYLPPYLTRGELAAIPPRPPKLRLAMLRPSDSHWTTGPTLSFQEHRRAVIVAVTPRRLTAGNRATVEAVLDSLRIGVRGQCRARAFERG